jgi:Membrane dipeptidase (Peptidase family M19)
MENSPEALYTSADPEILSRSATSEVTLSTGLTTPGADRSIESRSRLFTVTDLQIIPEARQNRMDTIFRRPTIDRSSIRKILVGSILAILSLAYITGDPKSIDPLDYAARTKNLLSTTPLIDGHNDLPFMVRIELENKIYDTKKFTFRDGLLSHTDLNKLKVGGVGGQFWSVFVDCPSNDIDFNIPSVCASSYWVR